MAIGVQISSFVLVGAPTLNQIFGFFAAPSSVQVQRLQITAQTAPAGGNITVTLVNAAGTSLGASVVLPSGSTYYDQMLAAPLTLAPGAVVRAKVTGIDNGTATDIVVNLIGATTQGTPAPSGCMTHECAPPVATALFFAGSVAQEQAAALASANAAAASAAAAGTSKTAAATSATAAAASAVASAASAATAATSVTSAGVQAAAAAASAVTAANAASAAGASETAAAASAVSAAASAAAAALRSAASVGLTTASVHTIADATETAVSWDLEDFDDQSFWDAGAPTRLTVPAGVTRVRLTAGIRWTANGTGERRLKIRGNPAGTHEANSIWASDDRPSDDTGDATVTTPIITVAAGDYFEAIVRQDSGGNLDLNTTGAADNHANFLCIEVMKTT